MKITIYGKCAKALIKRMTGNITWTAGALQATCTDRRRYYGAHPHCCDRKEKVHGKCSMDFFFIWMTILLN
jgi:hypothetical protein